MTQKGETYTKVAVNLQRWAEDYMRINNLKRQRELAERIIQNGTPIHRARVNDLLKGRANSMKFLQLIVNSIYGGDYTAMNQYAVDKDGLDVLRYMAFKKTLTEIQKKTAMDIHEAFQQALKENKLSKIKEAIKILKS